MKITIGFVLSFLIGAGCRYASLDTEDFSRDVLANLPHRLFVLRDRTSGWADLGSPTRVLD
jgi:hypothetical protein